MMTTLPLAARMATLQPSPIIAMAQAVRDKQAGLEPGAPRVISLSIGVPGFLPPAYVHAAARDAVGADTGDYLPGRGSAALIAAWRGALAAKGFEYSEAEVCAQVGGKGALFNLLLALVGEGDEVIIPAPYWASYPEMVRLVGATPVLPYAGPAQDYKITPAQLAAAITPRTKVVLLNSPSNPTGMVYTAAEMAGLAAVLAQHPHVWVLSDDIYDQLMFAPDESLPGGRAPHVLDSQPGLKNRAILVNSISKTYGMPGWRVGLVAGPKHIIDAVLAITSQSQTHLPGVVQAAAAAALAGGLAFLAAQRTRLLAQRDDMLAACNRWGLTCPVPAGAFYVFPNLAAWLSKTTAAGAKLTDDVAVCQALLQECHVAAVPGGAFGDAAALRISFAGKEADLAEAISRVDGWVAGLR